MTAETNEMANDGWWPDDDHSPVTQLYRMRGANVAQIMNCGTGWKAFSMIEMNKSKTTGLALASPNPFVSDSREQAKTICEEYAQALYSDADVK